MKRKKLDPFFQAILYYTERLDAYECGRCPMETECSLLDNEDFIPWKDQDTSCLEEIKRGFESGKLDSIF